MRRLLTICLLALLSTSCGTGSPRPPQAAVSGTEASSALQEIAVRAARRTTADAEQICAHLADSCNGLSSGWRSDPVSSPTTPPTLVCDVALPATATQAGPRMLVITGLDSTGRSYTGQVLVERRDGHPVVHEPAFWLGIEYTSLGKGGGRAWNGANDVPRDRVSHDAAVRRACTDPPWGASQ